MVQEFFSSWHLFHYPYLAGWLICLLMAATGVFVVAKNQIFIGAAVAEASTLGIAFTLWLGGLSAAGSMEWLHSDEALSLSAVVFSVAASLVAGVWGESGREGHEGITGWLFLASMSLSVLIVSHSPIGMDEVLRLHSSSIIGATSTDVWVLFGLVLFLFVFLHFQNQKIVLLAVDPVMAGAVGVRTRLWSVLISLWLGLTVGWSMRIAGMVFTFGCLVLPVMAAKNLSREVKPLFWVAPAVSVAAGGVSYMVANYYDFPPGQMTVAVLSLLVLGSWAVRSGAGIFKKKG